MCNQIRGIVSSLVLSQFPRHYSFLNSKVWHFSLECMLSDRIFLQVMKKGLEISSENENETQMLIDVLSKVESESEIEYVVN